MWTGSYIKLFITWLQTLISPKIEVPHLNPPYRQSWRKTKFSERKRCVLECFGLLNKYFSSFFADEHIISLTFNTHIQYVIIENSIVFERISLNSFSRILWLQIEKFLDKQARDRVRGISYGFILFIMASNSLRFSNTNGTNQRPKPSICWRFSRWSSFFSTKWNMS